MFSVSDPKNWGPSSWKILHVLAYTYPEIANYETQVNIEKFIASFSELLPCNSCKDDFKKYVQKYPVKSKTRESLIQWTVDLHNSVNKKLGKKLLTYDEAKKVWNSSNETCTSCNAIENSFPPTEKSKLTKYLKMFQFIFFIMFIVFFFGYINTKYNVFENCKLFLNRTKKK